MGINFEELFRKRFGRAPTVEEMTVLIDQSVTSHNQTGGITAHTVNIAPPKRVLDAQTQLQLLRLPKTEPFTIMAIMGNTEAEEFAMAIHKFMQSAGLPMAETGISRGIFTGIVKGLQFDPAKAKIIVGVNEAG